MHSLSNELLNMKVIHMTASVMAAKRQKLLKCNRAELVTIDNEVRAELSQPWITDVLHSPHVQLLTILKPF